MISVIIPAYNVEKYITKSLKSVINQSYSNIQIIIVDDGSTDKTYNICTRFAKKDKRILLLRQEHSGVSAARNLGLSVAEGSFVTFLDGDDWIPVDALKELHDAVLCNDADLVLGAMSIVSIYGESKDFTVQKGTILFDDTDGKINAIFDHRSPLGYIAAKLFKMSIISKFNLRFDETMQCFEDSCFVYSYLKMCYKIEVIEKTVYYYNRLVINAATRKYQEQRALWDYKKNELQYDCISECVLSQSQKNILFNYYLKGFWIITRYYLGFGLNEETITQKIEEIYNFYSKFISDSDIKESEINKNEYVLLYKTQNTRDIIDKMKLDKPTKKSMVKELLIKAYMKVKIFKYFHC